MSNVARQRACIRSWKGTVFVAGTPANLVLDLKSSARRLEGACRRLKRYKQRQKETPCIVDLTHAYAAYKSVPCP